jgi:SOS-response transcriptional repressor LexA
MSWNERLRALVKELGLTMAELERRSGVPYDSINKYLRGEVENPRGDTLDRLAKALGTTVVYLRTGLTDRKPLPSRAVPYRGKVAAGVWLEIDQAFEPEEWLPFNPVPQYPEGAVYCLTVEGDSIDRIAPQGSVLVCVDLYESGVTIRDGDLVIVERSKQQDGLRETTAKRVRSVPGGLELYPESSNPKWLPIFVPDDRRERDDTLQIKARVEYIMSRP